MPDDDIRAEATLLDKEVEVNRNPLRKFRPLGDECIQCGVTIPRKRLNSLPDTVLCVVGTADESVQTW